MMGHIPCHFSEKEVYAKSTHLLVTYSDQQDTVESISLLLLKPSV